MRGARQFGWALTLAVGAAALFGVGPARAETKTVTSVAFQYLLPTTVIAPGDSLDYVNLDVAPHNVFSLTVENGAPLFQSATINAGQTAPVVGVEALAEGSYTFTCTIHPNMLGTLQVGGSAVALPVGALPAGAGPVPTPSSIEIVGDTLYATSHSQGSVVSTTLGPGGLPAPALPFATGFTNPLGVAVATDGTVFVADSHTLGDGVTVGRVTALPPSGGDRAAGATVIDGLPNGRHNTNDMAVHGDRLYITNGNRTDDGFTGAAEQPLSGTLLSVPLGARNLGPTSPEVVVEARGLRNPFDVAFRPGTNEAWMTNNGPDAADPFGEDSLVKVDVTGPTADFGFPNCLYRSGTFGPEVATNPAAAAAGRTCGAHTPPERLLGLHVSANGLAFAPEGSPWAGDLLIAEFGSNPGESFAGHAIVRVPVDGGRAGAPVQVVPAPAPLDVAFGPAGLYVGDYVANLVYVLSPVA